MRDTSVYRVNGERVPSVTEVLKLCDVHDYFGVSGKVLHEAAQRGDEVHNWIELRERGHLAPDVVLEPPLEGYCRAYLRFREDAAMVVRDVERIVVSQEYRYAGRIDLVAELPLLRGDGEVVIDAKCVSLVQKATRLQVAGYALAAGIKRRGSLQLRPDGHYRWKEYGEEDDVRDWLSCVRVAHWKLRHGIAELED